MAAAELCDSEANAGGGSRYKRCLRGREDWMLHLTSSSIDVETTKVYSDITPH